MSVVGRDAADEDSGRAVGAAPSHEAFSPAPSETPAELVRYSAPGGEDVAYGPAGLGPDPETAKALQAYLSLTDELDLKELTADQGSSVEEISPPPAETQSTELPDKEPAGVPPANNQALPADDILPANDDITVNHVDY